MPSTGPGRDEVVEHTRKVAQFIVDTQYADLPAAALAHAKDAIMDGVGVALAGSQDEAGQIGREMMAAESGGTESTVFAGKTRLSSAGAAFANGISGHALDFDF